MYIGEEGEALAQRRVQQQKTYAEDLRRQIEEKNNKPKSPAILDEDIFGNTTGNRFLNNRINNLNDHISYQPPQPPLIRNAGTNLAPINDSVVVPAVANPQRNAPALGHVSPRLQPLPDLPPSTGPSPDAIRFADRLVWLETSVDQHQNILKAASDSANRLERTAIPSLNDGIQQLRSALERVMSVDIPGRMRPLEEENSRLEERINSATVGFNQQATSLRDRLSETDNIFTETTRKFDEFAEGVKSTLMQFKADISRSRDSHDSLAQRISGSESRAAQLEEVLRTVAASLSNFEKTAGDTITSSQSQINGAVSAASLQLAADIKQELDAREQQTNIIHNQVEEVNQRVGSSVSQVNSLINDLNTSFRQSLNSLSTSVTSALEDTRASTDLKYSEISDRLDSLLTETDNNFNTVQNEAISTLSSINENSVKSRDILTSALQNECMTRRKNETDIAKRYEKFMSVIMNEMQLQTSQMEEMCNQATAKLISQSNEQLIPLKNEVLVAKERLKSIDTVVHKTNNAEHLVNTINTQLLDNVAALGRQSSTIVNAVQKLRSEASESVDALSERLRIVEEQESTPAYATRKDVQEAFSRLTSDFDGRMQDIEQQIGVIFSSLSDLTMTHPAPQQTRGTVTAELGQLAIQAAESV